MTEPIIYASIELDRNFAILYILSTDGTILCEEFRSFPLEKSTSFISITKQELIREVLIEFIEVARLNKVPVWEIIGISNQNFSAAFEANRFIDDLNKELGLRLQKYSPLDESIYLYRGLTYSLNFPKVPLGLCVFRDDQVHFVMENNGEIIYQYSLPIAPRFLIDTMTGTQIPIGYISKIRNDIVSSLKSLQWPYRPRFLICQGLDVSVLTSLILPSSNVTSSQIHGAKLTRGNLRNVIDHLLLQPNDPSLQDTLYPNRSHTCLVTSVFIEEIATHSMRDSIMTSSGSLLLGKILSHIYTQANLHK
jgi:exopolyphosphatase/pppGpp-phosphohydrolase